MFIKKCVLVMVVIAMTGCSTYSANRYAVSVDNISVLKQAEGAKIQIGDFESIGESQTSIMCRGVGPIKTPDGQSFENFIRKAFVDELKMAELYASEAPVKLTGTLDSIDFSSASGQWNIAVTINSTNGHSLSVIENYEFTSSFYGETACNQTAQALMPAVQNLIGKIVRSKDFSMLISNT